MKQTSFRIHTLLVLGKEVLTLLGVEIQVHIVLVSNWAFRKVMMILRT